MKTQVIKPSLTLLDGTTYQKEFPAWVAANPGGMIAASMEQDKKLRPKQSSGSTQSVYYESLKWIFIVLTLAGILPVVKLRIGNHKLGAIIVGGICVGVYIVFGYYTYFLIKNVLFLIFHDDDFNTAISQVIMVMLLIQHVFYLILTWPESLAVNKYLAQWKNFQSQYEMLTGQELVLSCQRKLLFLMSVAFAMSASYPYLIGLTNKKQVLDSTSHVVLSYHIFILLNFYIMWLGNSWAVTQAAEQYNVQLTQECEGDITAERLEDYRLVWMRLSELVRAGSSMLAYTTALTVTTPFAYEVIAAYNLTMHVIRSIRTQGAHFVTMEALTTSATFLVFGMMLYSFCNSGHCMTLRCEKIQNVLLTHKPKLPSIATRVNSELRLFLRCLRSVPPLATLSGYVTVNRKVFLHMTGVLITYLIILVQFNIGSIKDTPASTSNNKTTS